MSFNSQQHHSYCFVSISSIQVYSIYTIERIIEIQSAIALHKIRYKHLSLFEANSLWIIIFASENNNFRRFFNLSTSINVRQHFCFECFFLINSHY